ncbi:iron complex transport system substrate-binding protein [Desulfohalotomaculum tongense]|uniref:ABC transporter substrate-binding protein n=1 Tax=Desulforadius tongensis TaxID=1216062 RepID=UPI0019595679|nr:iron complex transport system substrate-binding protein [Desulforadius tongensis]
MKKRIFLLLVNVFLMLVILVGCGKTGTVSTEKENGAIKIVDDLGRTIILKEPAKRIISLYSAHTENLFALGLDEEIIGVSTRESYPPEALNKPQFDYRSDPEKVLAQQPDLVLIRPFIKRSSPDFVQALENAGVKVVCLYPEKFYQFDDYIKRLAVLTGREKEAAVKLEQFHQKLNEIENLTRDIAPKKKVFFESTAREYRTITPDSIPAVILQLAGGINVAEDARPIRKGSSIAPYGAERLLDKADEIDVYIVQRGVMNHATPESVKQRPGFKNIKAVREGRIFTIDEKLVSSPTFRLTEGAAKLAAVLYPEKEAGRLTP